MTYCDVIAASVVGDLRFAVRFADGVEGEVEFLPAHLHGVFEPLRNPEFFRRIRVTDGFVTWPGDIDLAPDAMYEAIRRHGRWVLR